MDEEEEDIEKDEEAEVKEQVEGENKLPRYKKNEKFGKSSSVSWKKKSSFNSAKRVIDKKVLVPTTWIVKSLR